MKLLKCLILTILCCYLFGQGSGSAVKCGENDVFVGYCPANFNFGATMSITAWVKWNDVPTSHGTSQWANIASNNSIDASDQGQFWLQHNSDNSHFEFAAKSDYARVFATSTTTPVAGTWYHLAGVCDVTNRHLKIYVNGVQEADNTNINGTKIFTFADDFFFKAGKWSLGSSGRRFYGDIDELTLWNIALTESEVRNLMCQKLNGNETGLIGYWRFDENENETVEDLSPNSNHGYIFSESGQAESGSNTTLTDNQKTWIVNEWQDHYLGITAGTGSGQKRTILSNTTNTLTVTSAWDTNPDATSKYVIGTHDAWVTSGAPLGDESTYDFSSPATLSLNSTDGDGVEVSSITGTPTGVQVYRVDDVPNVSTAPGSINNLSSSHYFGVFTVGGTAPTYTLTYNYDGHPGITDESVLDLATRPNNASTSWTETNATLNETNNTLILEDQTGTEYILGSESGENALPVTLSSFTGIIENAYPVLAWSTESELENLGFIIERRTKGTLSWTEIANYRNERALEGHGTTSETHNYQFTDHSTIAGLTYEYCLNDVDYNGKVSALEILEIRTPEGISTPVSQFCLKEAYPNPFNPTTHISYEIAALSDVKIIIRDINGKSIQEWTYTNQQTGDYAVTWNAGDHPSGVYIFQMIANDFIDSKKMVLMK